MCREIEKFSEMIEEVSASRRKETWRLLTAHVSFLFFNFYTLLCSSLGSLYLSLGHVCVSVLKLELVSSSSTGDGRFSHL